MSYPHRVLIASTVGGAALGAASIVASALLAIGVTGFLPVFAENRGLLQLLIAIPVAAAVAGFVLASLRVLSPAQMIWALVPVEVLILVGAGAFAGDLRAWPWVVAVSACAFVPWLLGGSLARRGGPEASRRHVEPKGEVDP